MIGIIATTARGAVFQEQGYIDDEAARFLVGYREAATLAGLGVRMLPVILTGAWSFPGTGRLGEEKRCLVGLHDGSGNDSIYQSVLRCYPAISNSDDEVVISFIAAESFRYCSLEEALNTGRLAACFDLAAWAVDTLPGQGSREEGGLTKGEVKTLSLGIWANILVSWLCRMGIVSQTMLQKMRLAICGILIEKLTALGAAHACEFADSAAECAVESYIRAQPGIMVRLADMLACCPNEQLAYLPMNPEALCRAIVARSLRFFQGRDGSEGKDNKPV